MTQLLDPLQTDLLSAAFLHNDQAVPAWRRWRDSIDWDGHLDPDAFALLPAVYRNLRRLGADDPLLPRLKGIVRQSWLHNQKHIAALNTSLASLAQRRIEVLMLPPTSLWLIDTAAVSGASQPYHWAVTPAHAEGAIRCLQATGWRSRPIRLPTVMLPGYVRGARHLILENGDGRVLILTWALEYWFGERAGAVWNRSRPAELGKHRVRTLDPTDALEHTLRQSEAGTWLRRIAHALTIHAAAADSIDWLRLASELRHHPLPGAWAQALQLMQPFFTESSAPASLSRYCGNEPATTTNRTVAATPIVRARQDWAVYRYSWGGDYRTITALVQLPGYLMGRWNLSGPSQFPGAVYRWLRFNRNTQ